MLETETFFDMPLEPQIHAPKASLISRQISYRPPTPHLYQDISLIRQLGKGKFPVFLAKSKSQGKNYAMKVFPLLDEDDSIHPYFHNEIRFSSFRHPNVIKTVHVEHSKEFT